MSKLNLFINHPDKEEIVKKIFGGVSSKEISVWLKNKYSETDQSHLRLSADLIDEIRKSNLLSYYETLKEDVEKVKNNEEIDKKRAKHIKEGKSYLDHITGLAADKIDIKTKAIQMEELIRARVEAIFDKIAANPDSGSNNADYALIKYFGEWMKVLEFYNKSVNLAPDITIQHNHTIEYVDKRIEIIQTVVRELLQEMDPELEFKFLEKMQSRLLEAKLVDEKPQEVTIQKLNLLEEKIINYEVIEPEIVESDE